MTINIWIASILLLSASALAEMRTIAVTGKGYYEVKPDVIQIGFDVINTEARSLEEAKLTVDEATKKVIAALIKMGIEKDSITTNGFQLEQEPDYEEDCKISYIPAIGRSFEFKLKNIEKYNDVITALVNYGATNIDRPMGELLDYEKHERQALKLAIDNAKQEAKYLVENLGGKIGKVHSIGQKKVHNKYYFEEVVVTGIRASAGKYEHLHFNPRPVEVNAEIYVEFEIE